MFGGMTCSERWQLAQLEFKVAAIASLQESLYKKNFPKENYNKLLEENTKIIEKIVLEKREDIKNLKKLAEEERESNEDFFKVFGLESKRGRTKKKKGDK